MSNGTGRPTLHGAFTALVTPFAADGSLDEASLRQLVRWQVLAGIDGLVPCGTTGESPTLTQAERDRVIALTVETVAERPSRSRVTVIAGTGTNDTAATIAATRRAAELGADAALVITPYYSRPTQEGLYRWYGAVAREFPDLPIVIYNVPVRTAVDVAPETVARLCRDFDNVVGIKETTRDFEHVSYVLREAGTDFIEIPGEMVALCAAARAGDWDTARRIHDRWLPLFRANFAGGPNPVPVKAALSMIGLIGDVLRPPLLPLEESARQSLADVLRQAGLVELSGGRIVRTERTDVGEQVVA
ncbi:MAG: 4-hydroxy-tetrahydrodipicolinate synthase [Chloroflexi bacterium]|nr:MAG: 4-hydroxy-tetrahydrodipicolinate synthase [Chloroflexota bacterium]